MLIGTTNTAKVFEIASILNVYGIGLKSVSLNFEEVGHTFKENALQKAETYSAQYPDEWIITEDSGLVIDHLGGSPGLYSARYYFREHPEQSKEGLSREEIDALNNEFVLKQMKGVPVGSRAAYFHISLGVVKNGVLHFYTEAQTPGWISEELKGTQGFGYDPLFIGEDTYGKTYAELDSRRKNLKSHRKKALKDFDFWISNKVLSGEIGYES